jgi:hypothetical protein
VLADKSPARTFSKTASRCVNVAEDRGDDAKPVLHVASMLHGAAGTGWQPLKLRGFISQHTQHENGPVRSGPNARNVDFIGIYGWLGD